VVPNNDTSDFYMKKPIKFPRTTNRGTALFKYLHQTEKNVLFKDSYIHWFIENVENIPTNAVEAFIDQNVDPESEFQRTAFRYTIFREKFFDDFIENAVHAGYKRLVLLGAGFDTRFLRLPILKEKNASVIEVDILSTINVKKEILKEKLGHIPERLSLIAMDLSENNLKTVLHNNISAESRTVLIWQGVSYYLKKDVVSSILDAIKSFTPTGTLLGFDCCSPLMLFDNDKIPGIRFNIVRLAKIGEPYLFGMPKDKMEVWLKEKGFRDVMTYDQQLLEEKYTGGKSLPGEMWYIVTAGT